MDNTIKIVENFIHNGEQWIKVSLCGIIFEYRIDDYLKIVNRYCD